MRRSTLFYSTCSRSRGNRLPDGCYPENHPVHVILTTHQRMPVFRRAELAQPIFAIVADHSMTTACCLMPDHLHWLMTDASSMGRLVHSFKSYTTYVARTLGHRGKLWQRSYWDHVVRRDESLRELAHYIAHNPVRRGLVDDCRKYPYSTSPT